MIYVGIDVANDKHDCCILTIFNNVSPLPCSHFAYSDFCIHLEFLPEIVCKVEKVRSTFHTLHDYLNFCGEKKMTGYLLFTFIDKHSYNLYYYTYNWCNS